jgi:hypothetical protein
MLEGELVAYVLGVGVEDHFERLCKLVGSECRFVVRDVDSYNDSNKNGYKSPANRYSR